jgi:tetratricopeptide (TPR) repeat protein
MLTLAIGLPLAVALAVYGFSQGDYLLVLVSLLLGLGAASLNAGLLRRLYSGYAALTNRGAYYHLKGDYDRAVAHYTRALQRRPQQAALYTARAAVYIHLQETALALADVERALEIEPGHLLANLLRSELYSLEKCFDQALEWCQRALQLKPDWSYPFADRAGIYLEQGDPARALTDLDRAIELNPRLTLAFVLRSLVRRHLGDREGARADAEQAFRLAPKDALVFPEFFLPTFTGHLDWARDYFGQALKRMPGSPLPYQGRAGALRANREWEPAIQDYTRAIALAPRQAELYLGRGQAYQGAGDLARAAGDYRRVRQQSDKSHLRRQAEALERSVVSA